MCGMFYKDGVWHLCYQWNPYGSKWQNMTWGHSTSKDLVNWEHQPATIIPDGLGTIFSGSSVVDTNNTAGYGKNAVVTLYTSCDASQVQSMAHSTDNGATFTKYAGNPIITLDTEARDPNMFWHEPTQQWVLVLAHALEHEMLIYTSPNLRDWTLQSSFGKGLGCQSGVWECPDLFELPVDGNGVKKWVLICNINPGGPFGGSAAQYFVGDFDGKTFTPDRDKQGNVPTKWLDFGKDNYASVSFSDAPDNRRTLIGWMNNWQYAAEVPTLQYRSANTLPLQLLWVVIGVLVVALGASLYQTADLGVAPYDALSLMLADRLPVPYFGCRIFTDALCAVIAWLLGGLIGLGTLLCAFALGPFVQFFTKHFSEKVLQYQPGKGVQ